MRARRTPAAKFKAELCGAKDQRQHQLSTACKMQVKVVLRRLPDLYVSQAHRPEHQEPACIKEEEESGPIQGTTRDFQWDLSLVIAMVTPESSSTSVASKMW
ncbi:uncharacterized protein LOC130928542 isoform X3 [Corythoichthys intestinalis]|uniref:uncharacterized protein LOC130928542 isoform X3 n=1 Tax=Corythoichthys intestinalis TaxID=161448 RepID=UPI0025A67512|nr:uncharacterized protein LOC130928542 isoform X3 [Corythoichthys intestinalis]